MTVPLILDATQTDLAADVPVYAYIVGLVQGVFYRLDAAGLPYPMNVNDNTQAAGGFPGSDSLDSAAIAALAPNYPSAWADYSIPVSRNAPATQLDLSQINTANIPGLSTGTNAFSGRIYVSVGLPPLPFTVQTSGYTAPVPYPDGPGSQCLFDWIEFSYDSEGNFNGNTTQVDQFGFAMSLNGAPGGSLQGLMSVSRDTLLAQIQGLGGPFQDVSSVIAANSDAAAAYPAGIANLRAQSPKTLTAMSGCGAALPDYFDSSLGDWYLNWQTTPLVVNDASTGYYTGVVDGDSGVLNFYQGQYATVADWQAAAPALAFSMTGAAPSTVQIASLDVWQCNNSLNAGGAAQQNVGKNIAAAFNRGVPGYLLDDTTCQSVAGSFYPAGGAWSAWAALMHQANSNALACGFPYDDVCEQSPTVQLDVATQVSVVLGNFYS
ncbi:beta-1,3-glucanase family protein [Lysobacter sp. CA199]|uniref:beta-1,3-glucanase family protein n=1 Tax=Lysobacter sp. CA199 TaxID=3455608 RepID=UPI003F8D4A53